MLKRALHYLTIGLVGLMVLGCATTSTTDTPVVPVNNPTPFPGYTFPLLDLTNGIIPLPNDLLRDSTASKIAFPKTGEPFDAINTLNGWSTSGPIIIPFKGTIKTSSVSNDTVKLFNIETNEQVPLAFQFEDQAAGTVILAAPIRVLEPQTRYVLVVTNGVISAVSDTPVLSDAVINLLKRNDPLVDSNGVSTIPGLKDSDAAALEPVRNVFQKFWIGAERATGINRADIPIAFGFTTQGLFGVLPGVRTAVVNSNQPMVNPLPFSSPLAIGHGAVAPPAPNTPPNIETFFASLPAPLNAVPTAQLAAIGRIYLVQIQMPVYRNDKSTDFWANPPVQTGTRQVPALVFMPQANSATPGSAPVPAVIFQHGLGGNKFLAALLAAGVNAQGQALVAIDLEHHGALSAANTSGSTLLPIVITPDPLFAGDPVADVSRTLNIANLRNARDNNRQSVADLYALTQAIVGGGTNFDGVAGNELTAASPTFFGTSLGGIVGDVFLATEPNISRGAINAAGGRIFNLLLNSPAFSQNIIDGLAAKGVVKGTLDFDIFGLISQTVIDDVDPINYAKHLVTGDLRGNNPGNVLQQVYVTDTTVPPLAQYDLAIQHGAGTSNPAFSQVDATSNTETIAALARTLIAQVSSPFTGAGMYEVTNATHTAIFTPTLGPSIGGQIISYLLTGTINGNAALRTRAVLEATEEPNQFEGYDPFQLHTH